MVVQTTYPTQQLSSIPPFDHHSITESRDQFTPSSQKLPRCWSSFSVVKITHTGKCCKEVGSFVVSVWDQRSWIIFERSNVWVHLELLGLFLPHYPTTERTNKSYQVLPINGSFLHSWSWWQVPLQSPSSSFVRILLLLPVTETTMLHGLNSHHVRTFHTMSC